MIGKVIMYNAEHGYGFIRGRQDKKLFVNYTAIMGRHQLRTGQRVDYQVAPGRRGPQAVKVQILSS